jgi:hypothetical protein
MRQAQLPQAPEKVQRMRLPEGQADEGVLEMEKPQQEEKN